jgi:hypothetical protein
VRVVFIVSFVALVAVVLGQTMPKWPLDYQTAFKSSGGSVAYSGFMFVSGETNQTRLDIKQGSLSTSTISKILPNVTQEWLIMHFPGGITTCTHREYPDTPSKFVCGSPTYRGEAVIDGVSTRRWDVTCTDKNHVLPSYFETYYFATSNNYPVRFVVYVHAGNVTTDFSYFKPGRVDPGVFTLPPQCGGKTAEPALMKKNGYAYPNNLIPLWRKSSP